jgi:hypothetical protein
MLKHFPNRTRIGESESAWAACFKLDDVNVNHRTSKKLEFWISEHFEFFPDMFFHQKEEKKKRRKKVVQTCRAPKN